MVKNLKIELKIYSRTQGNKKVYTKWFKDIQKIFLFPKIVLEWKLTWWDGMITEHTIESRKVQHYALCKFTNTTQSDTYLD